MFAKKLKKLGNSVNLDVLEGLPHGFLNFSMVRFIFGFTISLAENWSEPSPFLKFFNP